MSKRVRECGHWSRREWALMHVRVKRFRLDPAGSHAVCHIVVHRQSLFTSLGSSVSEFPCLVRQCSYCGDEWVVGRNGTEQNCASFRPIRIVPRSSALIDFGKKNIDHRSGHKLILDFAGFYRTFVYSDVRSYVAFAYQTAREWWESLNKLPMDERKKSTSWFVFY